ncbi:hypothetical protein [Clostridium ljungdahlii]|uniref:hypothetical protein n=1 Tax=Clostridium ljungdahlii TaxID=1538 RepID=UPI003863477F
MKTGKELYGEHLNRLKDVINMKKTDRVPIVLNADAFVRRTEEESYQILSMM